MKSLHHNKTYILVYCLLDKIIVYCKWIYKVKKGLTSARLVAKGFTQAEGVDYNEIIYPLVKSTTIRVILSLVNTLYWDLK